MKVLKVQNGYKYKWLELIVLSLTVDINYYYLCTVTGPTALYVQRSLSEVIVYHASSTLFCAKTF